MKTPLGTEVALGSGHIVLDADPAPPAKGAHQTPFSAHVYFSSVQDMETNFYAYDSNFGVREFKCAIQIFRGEEQQFLNISKPFYQDCMCMTSQLNVLAADLAAHPTDIVMLA